MTTSSGFPTAITGNQKIVFIRITKSRVINVDVFLSFVVQDISMYDDIMGNVRDKGLIYLDVGFKKALSYSVFACPNSGVMHVHKVGR